MRRRATLPQLVSTLREQHGEVAPPPCRDAFALVAWEKVAYLATDERRRAAFELLERSVGVTPERVLAAPRARLVEVLATGGIGAGERADNLRQAAEVALGDGNGSLDGLCELPLADARRALKRIRGIGDPGAEKVLLFTRNHPVMGLDSNGLRVLVRLGFGREAKSYGATYKSVTEAALPEMRGDMDSLIEANLLLRHHGQQVCKTSRPKCGECALRSRCPSAPSPAARASSPVQRSTAP